MNPVRVGIIGCGYWGPNLIRNFVELPGSDVIAVSDLRQERLAHIKSRFPSIKVTQDYEALFHMGLDGVVIATPPATHYQLARESLLHNLPVMVEKPLTLSSGECLELMRLSRMKGLALMVGHTFEYHPAVRTLRRIVQSGELGQVYYISSVRANLGLFQRALNVVWDLAPHDLSMILFVLEQEPISVSATGGSFVFPGVHDIAHLHLGFPDRVIAHVHVSWLDPCKMRRLTVVGSRKMAVFDDVDPTEKIKIYDKGVEAPPYTDTLAEFHLSYRYGDVLIPHIDSAEPLRLECEDFLRAISYGVEPQAGGESALRVIRIIEAASRSLENGGGGELVFDQMALIDEHLQV
jgi:predicted dehydrogenase